MKNTDTLRAFAALNRLKSREWPKQRAPNSPNR